MSLAWLKYVVTRPLNLFLILSLGSCEGHRVYLDYRLKSLCKEYGGIEVFERASVSESEYERLSKYIPSENQARGNSRFFQDTEKEIISKGKIARIYRRTVSFYESPERKIIAQYTSFSRKGGGIPIPLAPDHAESCISLGLIKVNWTRSIFHVERDSRHEGLGNSNQ